MVAIATALQTACYACSNYIRQWSINAALLIVNGVFDNLDAVLTSCSGFLRKIGDTLILVSLALATFYFGARVELTPRDPAKGAALVFAPWTTADETLSKALASGGRFVRFGGLPFIAVVVPDEHDHSSRLFDTGAWLVLDPETVAACSRALSLATSKS